MFEPIKANGHLYAASAAVASFVGKSHLTKELLYLELLIRKSGYTPESLSNNSIQGLLRTAFQIGLSFCPKLAHMAIFTTNDGEQLHAWPLVLPNGFRFALKKFDIRDVSVVCAPQSSPFTVENGLTQTSSLPVAEEACAIATITDHLDSAYEALVTTNEISAVTALIQNTCIDSHILAQHLAIKRALKLMPIRSREFMDLIIWVNSGHHQLKE